MHVVLAPHDPQQKVERHYLGVDRVNLGLELGLIGLRLGVLAHQRFRRLVTLFAIAEDSDRIRATPVDSTEPCHHLSARMLWSAGCIYAGRRSRRSSVSAQWWPCLSRNQRLRHDRSTIRRRLEEAAGVEAQFEATQSTETPLEFLLRKMRVTGGFVTACRGAEPTRRAQRSRPLLSL
jgi:hypothetical protein